MTGRDKFGRQLRPGSRVVWSPRYDVRHAARVVLIDPSTGDAKVDWLERGSLRPERVPAIELVRDDPDLDEIDRKNY
jgi:hypothetical protein